MPNYRSLVGGYFSSTPFDKSIPTSIRCNNPGALNASSWERKYAGFVDEIVTTPGNSTAIFETPEQGVAAYWELLRRYATSGDTSIRAIITRYGGGQDYSKYLDFVVKEAGLPAFTTVRLTGYDDDLLKIAKAMFHYEAGKAIPWSDAQILYGFNLGRQYAGGVKAAPPVTRTSKTNATAAAGATVLVGAGAAIASFMEISMFYVITFVAGYLIGAFSWPFARDKIGQLLSKPPTVPPPQPPAV